MKNYLYTRTYLKTAILGRECEPSPHPAEAWPATLTTYNCFANGLTPSLNYQALQQCKTSQNTRYSNVWTDIFMMFSGIVMGTTPLPQSSTTLLNFCKAWQPKLWPMVTDPKSAFGHNLFLKKNVNHFIKIYGYTSHTAEGWQSREKKQAKFAFYQIHSSCTHYPQVLLRSLWLCFPFIYSSLQRPKL